jgi:hypothetical protein
MLIISLSTASTGYWFLSICLIQLWQILNASWSSQPNKQAITWFDVISVTALDGAATTATTPEDISATKGPITNKGRADWRNIGFAVC